MLFLHHAARLIGHLLNQFLGHHPRDLHGHFLIHVLRDRPAYRVRNLPHHLLLHDVAGLVRHLLDDLFGVITGDLDRDLFAHRLRHVLHLLDLLGHDVRLPNVIHLVRAAIGGHPIEAGPLIDGHARDRIDRRSAALPGQPAGPPAWLEGHLVVKTALIDELRLLRHDRLHDRMALLAIDGFRDGPLDGVGHFPLGRFGDGLVDDRPLFPLGRFLDVLHNVVALVAELRFADGLHDRDVLLAHGRFQDGLGDRVVALAHLGFIHGAVAGLTLLVVDRIIFQAVGGHLPLLAFGLVDQAVLASLATHAARGRIGVLRAGRDGPRRPDAQRYCKSKQVHNRSTSILSSGVHSASFNQHIAALKASAGVNVRLKLICQMRKETANGFPRLFSQIAFLIIAP